MSLRRYRDTKPSGALWLGDIPSSWQVKRLKYLCVVLPSNVDKKTYVGELPVKLCNYTDAYYNQEITAGLEFMSATATPEQVSRFSLRSGDSVVTKDSETSDDIAVAAYVPRDLPGVVCGYHLAIVRPKGPLHGRYVKRLFDSKYLKSRFDVAANGLTRVGLSQYAFDNVEVPLPPRDEQDQIIAFLERETQRIDALVAQQEKLVELLKDKRQAVILHAVVKGLYSSVPMKRPGLGWMGDIPAHWKVQRIKYFVRSFEQGWSPQCESFPAGSDDWGVLKVGCVNGGRFDRCENKALPEGLNPMPELGLKAGDLLISRANTRELVGSAAVVPSDDPKLMVCDKLYRIRFDPLLADPRFFARYLGTEVARGQIELNATGASASMVNIGQRVVLDLPIAVPPLAEQVSIVQELERADQGLASLLSEAERAIELLRERRSALIHMAVTGQIDVRELAPAEFA